MFTSSSHTYERKKITVLQDLTLYILGDIHPYFLQNAGRLGARLNYVPLQPGFALPAGRLRFRFPMVSLEFFMDIILPAALYPWGRLSLQQK